MKAVLVEIEKSDLMKDDTQVYFYETRDLESVVILKRTRYDDSEEWKIESSVLLPIKAFEALNYFCTSSGKMTKETLKERSELPDDVAKVLYKFDHSTLPLTENQLGYFQELEWLNDAWGIENFDSPNQTPRKQSDAKDSAPSNTFTSIQSTPENKRPASPDFSRCLAPKSAKTQQKEHLFATRNLFELN